MQVLANEVYPNFKHIDVNRIRNGTLPLLTMEQLSQLQCPVPPQWDPEYMKRQDEEFEKRYEELLKRIPIPPTESNPKFFLIMQGYLD